MNWLTIIKNIMAKNKDFNSENNLPKELIDRYKNWKSNTFDKNKTLYEDLSLNGQKPSSMIISCCDSRVNPTSIFGAKAGDFFIHRNIANLIPPYSTDSDNHGTSAAVEFAVCVLKVSNIIILGHSSCGGIKSGYYNCKGDELNQKLPSINKWLKVLEPAYNELEQQSDDQLMIKSLEKVSIIKSVNNLMQFPCVEKSLESNNISIHGLWNDIGKGELEILNLNTLTFEKLT